MTFPSLTETQRLAEVARQGLRMVAEGEDKTIEGWLIYGRALLAGRDLLASNNRFHDWKVLCQLDTTDRHDEAAAMWAASDGSAFDYMREVHPRVRTVRGLHAKWKEAQRPEVEPKPTFEEPTEGVLRRILARSFSPIK